MFRLRSLVTISIILLSVWTAYSQVRPAAEAVPLGGLSSPVRVHRDGRGIPYIEASKDADLYFVQGYITASDRLWQMDVLRRRARGETAEIFGQLALADDKIWRRYGFARVAEENLKHLSPELRGALESYAAGVNAYIASLTSETMPAEFRILQYAPAKWRPADTIVIGKILAEALSSTWRQDVQRAAAASLPADKFHDLTNQVTPFDVVLFGNDAPIVRPNSEPVPAANGPRHPEVS